MLTKDTTPNMLCLLTQTNERTEGFRQDEERSAAHICNAINTTDSMKGTRYTFKALRLLELKILPT